MDAKISEINEQFDALTNEMDNFLRSLEENNHEMGNYK